MSWWQDLARWFRGTPAPEPAPAPAMEMPAVPWISAEDNRFGVRLLDLSPVTLQMQSFSQNPEYASRAVSWGHTRGAELSAEITVANTYSGSLRYPAAEHLPDGLLSEPYQMEDKWVTVWRGGQILMARSWTGEVAVVADTRREGDDIVVTEIRAAEPDPLAFFSDPLAGFDWMLRSLALGEVLPMPVSEDQIAMLEQTPLLAFSIFGRMALCAAVGWTAPAAAVPLRTDGELLYAVREDDIPRIRELVAAGAPLSARSRFQGYTPLHMAMIRGKAEVVEALVALGAEVDAAADRGLTPLGAGIINGAAEEILRLLVAHGAVLGGKNVDGFGYLHAVAECGRPELVGWLLGEGLSLEEVTGNGLRALHIAAGRGQAAVARVLVEAGAQVDAPSPYGTPMEIASREGQAEVAAVLS